MGATKIGDTLGGFRILECLGSGGAGTIWKAEDLGLGRIVALKALRQELVGDDAMAARFRAEARALAKLSHANVASLYSLMENEDGLYLVLEYVEGSTLAALLAASAPLPFGSAYLLFHQVLDGVGHAHEAGVVHRDLKPANLMVDARGRIKVMDFGIARVAGAERTTHHGKLVGTPEYMSPEQIRGEDATIRSDVYSLGIVLYEMLTGTPPFRSPTSFEAMRAQLEDAPADPRTLRAELPEAVAATLLRALAKQPAERFAGTRELQDALLAAGATRRGMPVLPIWQEQAAARAAREARTLMTRGPDAPAPDAKPASASLERCDAPATEVFDSTQDTAQLAPPPPPTLMMGDAPFAANAGALRGASAARRPRRRVSPLLWVAAALGALALGAGAVRIASRGAAHEAAEWQAAAEAAPPPPAAAPQPAPAPVTTPAAAAESAPGPAPEPPPKPRPAAKPTKRKASPPPEPAPEESGWVIRR